MKFYSYLVFYVFLLVELLLNFANRDPLSEVEDSFVYISLTFQTLPLGFRWIEDSSVYISLFWSFFRWDREQFCINLTF